MGEMTQTYTNNGMQEKLNNSGVRYGNQVNITKSRMDKQHTEREGIEGGSKAEIHIDLLRMTLKKYQIGKRHDGIQGFWFKKFTSFYDRLPLEMIRWMTKGRITLI